MASKRGVPERAELSKKNLIIKGIPVEYIDCSIDDYDQDEDTKHIFERYIDNMHQMYEDRVCLCLYGANGTGKTFLSSIIVKESYRLRYDSIIVTLAKLMDLTFKPDKSVEDWDKLNYIKKADFLVIDEVGKENFTKTKSNIALLEETMRQAIVSGQVVILCTNLPLEGEDGLYSQYGKSIESLIEGSYVKLEFDNKDYRKKVFKKKKGLKILLGEGE